VFIEVCNYNKQNNLIEKMNDAPLCFACTAQRDINMGISKSRLSRGSNSDKEGNSVTIITGALTHNLKKTGERLYVLEGRIGLTFIPRDGNDFIECMYMRGFVLEIISYQVCALGASSYQGGAITRSSHPTELTLGLYSEDVNLERAPAPEIKTFPCFPNMRVVIIER
jgi:hypothetical protein